MKNIALFFLTLIFLGGCDSNTLVPKGYYKATIIGYECTPVVQVRGNKDTKELDRYEYIYIKNLPDSLDYIGAEFYFRNYEGAAKPICIAFVKYPHLTINTYNISVETPK